MCCSRKPGDGAQPHQLVGCPICGLVQTLGPLASGTSAHCARCDSVLLRRGRSDPGQAALCLTLAALLLFLPSNFWPVLEVTIFGDVHGYTVMSGAAALWHGSMWPLAIPVALASVVLPAGLILLLLALSAAPRLGIGADALQPWRRLCDFLRDWSIVDVYVLAIFITVVKLAQLTDAAPALGSTLFLAMVVCLTLALRSFDAVGADLAPGPALGPDGVVPPRPGSAGRTLALASAALILFVPANVFPTLTVTAQGSTQTATVFGGVVDLWQAGMWALALIVVCASLLIPFFKIIGLLFLTLTLGRPADLRARTRLYRAIAQIGRWSMLDVYVISLLVAVLHFGLLAEAQAEIGSLAFAAVVIVTLLAARSFDPRLIWQHAGPQAAAAPEPARPRGA
jgi:paraquat-inducible protein A